MQLPFFKRRPANGPIDVTATPVRESHAAGPKTIVEDVLPDLGDYSAEYPEPLPESAKILPVITWAAILGAVAWMAWGMSEDQSLRMARKQAEAKLNSAKAVAAQLKSRADGLEGKEMDLQILTRWTSVSHPMRNVGVAVVLSAADKVQIRSLDIKRRDPNVLRYSIQLSCSGTRTNFEQMRKDLLARINADGWVVDEIQAGPEDPRLIFEATITRKQS